MSNLSALIERLEADADRHICAGRWASAKRLMLEASALRARLALEDKPHG
ncbi:MAG: hypothetical protein ACLGJC_09595 [Alphaproteobacteria bacterium]